MNPATPPIDSRTGAEIERQTVALLRTYAPDWNEVDPASGRATGVSAALVGVFARFAEITLQRLNRAPEKHELAFLDLIGAAPLPAQPARAPLSFALAAGASGATVPARTQVAAPPAPGRPAPVPFETVRELSVTAATLGRVITWDSAHDRRSDNGRVADPANLQPAIVFNGDGPLEHAIYFGNPDLLGYPLITGFGLSITLGGEMPATPDPRALAWEIWDGADGIPLTPTAIDGRPADSTNALTGSGYVGFPDIGQVPLTTVNGITSRWLRCRLLTPITASTEPVAGFVRASHLLSIGDVLIQGTGRSGPTTPDAAFAGTVPLDVSKDFLPFGADPKFGATWYIASRAVFSQAGRQIAVALTLTDPKAGRPGYSPSSDLVLVWEHFSEAGWTVLGRVAAGDMHPWGTGGFWDGTLRFTGSETISFVLHAPPRPTVVNGVENYWVRVRLVSGSFVPSGASPPVAPSVAKVTLTYDSSNSGFTFQAAFHVLREDAMSSLRLVMDAGLQPPAFAPVADPGRSLYLGLAFPAGGVSARPISLWADLAPIPADARPDGPAGATEPQLAWSYWNGADWSAITVADESGALTRSGEIRFLPPSDLAEAGFFKSPPLRWLRATWSGGEYRFLPRLRRLLLNTTLGEQAVTVTTETLGSSTGEPGQSFATRQSPVLDGVALDVIEPEWPSEAERTAIGGGAIVPVPGGGVAVRWQEVGDFHGSAPRDRHFTLDHATGTIRFGDGASGLIPPRGSGNLRLASYRTGGGADGNVPPAAVSQLKTTVPYVKGVTNVLAAAGGIAAETLDEMRTRAPRLIRHGGRAVTLDDFQDLARLASPEVARSLCVPVSDLTADADAASALPGHVSVVVVPRSDDAAPAPSADLIERVTAYLAACAPTGVTLAVAGPDYVTVDVDADIGLARLEGAAAVEEAIHAALAAFLHPLTGGGDGAGWDFGRRPHRSDLTRLLQSIEGVDHLRSLTVTETPARPGAIEAGRFLVSSGRHRVTLGLGEF